MEWKTTGNVLPPASNENPATVMSFYFIVDDNNPDNNDDVKIKKSKKVKVKKIAEFENSPLYKLR